MGGKRLFAIESVEAWTGLNAVLDTAAPPLADYPRTLPSVIRPANSRQEGRE
ncbi:hypothetical protein LPLAFNJD_LOCUS4412 [Methylorubrum aminovorans]|nr:MULTISPECIES: hypothetical protein [unclassified Methylobacterium]QIJ76052.1 hypothetical protein CLZ_16415 [Methylobacterium sp. CLZ]